MLTERDERLIQRCVDNEISTEQRRELMNRLELVSDGWKTLACTFMEEQLFGHAARQHALERPTLVTESKSSDKPRRHWFYHPLTSLALTLCVAFLSGVLISREFRQTGPQQMLASGPSEKSSSSGQGKSFHATTAADLVSNDSAYHVHLQGEEGRSQELPLYQNEDEFISQYEQHRQRVQKSLSNNLQFVDGRQPEVRFIRFPLEDGRTILVPVEEFRVTPRLQ